MSTLLYAIVTSGDDGMSVNGVFETIDEANESWSALVAEDEELGLNFPKDVVEIELPKPYVACKALLEACEAALFLLTRKSTREYNDSLTKTKAHLRAALMQAKTKGATQ